MTIEHESHDPGGDPCPPYLTQALQQVLYGSGLPIVLLAATLGRSVDALTRWAADPRYMPQLHWHLPAHMVVPLTQATQHYALLDALESAVGRLAFPRQTTTGRLEQTAYVLGQATAATQQLSEALQQGREPSQSVEPILPSIDRLLTALVTLKKPTWPCARRRRTSRWSAGRVPR